MYGMDRYGCCGFGINGPDGQHFRTSPLHATGQHDVIIDLDIPDHAYIDGNFKNLEHMAGKEKLVRKLGQGFYMASNRWSDMVFWKDRPLSDSYCVEYPQLHPTRFCGFASVRTNSK